MKLFELFHNMVDGTGQGQIAPALPLGAKRVRPMPLRPFFALQALSHVTKVMVQNLGSESPTPGLRWLLADADDSIIFVMQSGRAFDEGLFGQISKSPGFDKTAVRRALRSKRNARYVVWQHNIIADKASKTR
jgi:hypothetical protein